MQFRFSHHPAVWQRFPSLVAGVACLDHVERMHPLPAAVERHLDAARQRLETVSGEDATEGSWPEVQAWRRVFAQMGLKPTQVRCAAESLLRRLRKEGNLPSLHPLVDLCNAVSVHFAIPIAVFDMDFVAWPLEVRFATGSEQYENFTGASEAPEPGEVIFADAADHAHARRWAHRQSAQSAVATRTRRTLLVVEAMHQGAMPTVTQALSAIRTDLDGSGTEWIESAMLTVDLPVFTR